MVSFILDTLLDTFLDTFFGQIFCALTLTHVQLTTPATHDVVTSTGVRALHRVTGAPPIPATPPRRK